jgi:hypothetical protein
VKLLEECGTGSSHLVYIMFRLFYFSGEKLVNFLVEPKTGTKWPKNLPRFNDRTQAIAVCKELCHLQYILRCEKLGKGELGVSVFSMNLSRNRYCSSYLVL